jgi:phosphoribosylaminoimidazole carboxylase (NCAIR synthetase)
VHKSCKTIGIVGGGQLGRMLTQAAIPLGFKVVVIDPKVSSPAAQVGAEEITANFVDSAAIKKLAEKADFITIESEHIKSPEDAKRALKKFGGQMVLKTRHGGFDGRGNAVIKNEQELKAALIQFDSKLLYAEKIVPFKKELAVIVARDMKGNIKTYSVAETIHERNICQQVIVPARISEVAAKNALDLGIKTAKHLGGAGVFAVEMFLTNGGD